jgi:protein O-GlcNAc transferase
MLNVAARNDSMQALLAEAAHDLSTGAVTEALSHAKAALAIAPEYGPALHLAGLAVASMGDALSAIAFLEQAVHSQTDSAAWIADLGIAQYAAGYFDQAAENLCVAERAMSDATTSTMAGHALRKCGRSLDSIKVYRRALEFDPTSSAQFALGCALSETDNLQDALAVLIDYANMHPEHVGTHKMLAAVYAKLRLHAHAASSLRTVLTLSPGDAAARRSLPFAMIQSDPPEETLAFCERSLEDGPRSRFLESTSLMVRLHCTGETRASIRSAHEKWATRYLDRSTPRFNAFTNERTDCRRLKIGYIGGEFWFAPSYFFLIPILSNYDRSNFEIILYDTVGREDEATAAYRNSSTAFRKVHRCNPREVASLIRADQIDILVDLSGHYESQGLLVFAERAAPVQVTYPNYPSTTGVDEIDYILSDRWVCPEAHEDQYTERVHRLDTGYLSYAPPHCASAIDSQVSQSRSLTFGIFQRATKFNSRFWDAVAKILTEREMSRLLIHYGSGELDDTESLMRKKIADGLKVRGVSPDRILFAGLRPIEEHLRILAQADVALDTFPYNGQTTTCECLYLGLPVVTLVGDTHVSRVGWQLLARAGLERWAASSVEEYVKIALDGTADKEALGLLRRDTKERFRNSSIIDGKALTQEIERWYRSAWCQWIRTRTD